MALHYKLKDNAHSVALKIASKALSKVNSQSTAGIGDLYIPNYDENGFRDGTGTYIGSGSIGNGGVVEWVGDTIPPGKPTGVSATSTWGVVYCKWEGTLEGDTSDALDDDINICTSGVYIAGVWYVKSSTVDYSDGVLTVKGASYLASANRLQLPSSRYVSSAYLEDTGSNIPDDFAYVAVSINGVEVGKLTEAGSIAADGYTDGQEVVVGFTAYDAARDRTGALSPNASDTTTVTVTVSNDVDAIDEAVAKAEEAADAAKELANELSGSIEDITTSINGVEQELSSISTSVSGAVTTAEAALTKSTEVEQTVGSISSTASQALDTANDALTQSSSAVQTVESFKTTVEETYATKTDLSDSIAQEVLDRNSAIEQSATEITQSVSETYQVKGDYLTEDAASTLYATQSSVTQTAESILSEVSTTYVSQTDAEATYATKSYVDQQDDSITSTVSSVQTTADSALTQVTEVKQTVESISSTVSDIDGRVSTVEQTASGLEVRVTEAESTANSASSTASAAASAASAAQSTADSAASAASTAASAAEDAAKVATNYLSFSNDGLVVGDMTESTLGANTRITGSGVEIRNGTVVLSSFEDDEVHIGANSTSSSIYLCGDQARIGYNSSAQQVFIAPEDTSNGSVCILAETQSDQGIGVFGTSNVSQGVTGSKFYIGTGYTYFGTAGTVFDNIDLSNRLAALSSCVKIAGDTMNAAGYYAGIITGSGLSLRFSIPCVCDATPYVASSWVTTVRVDGSYVVGSSSGGTSISSSQIALTARGHHIDVVITFTTARSNNIVVGIQISSGTIGFE